VPLVVVFALSFGIVVVTSGLMLFVALHRSSLLLQQQQKKHRKLVKRLHRQRMALNKIILCAIVFLAKLLMVVIGCILFLTLEQSVSPISDVLIDICLVRIIPTLTLVSAIVVFMWPWQLPLWLCCIRHKKDGKAAQSKLAKVLAQLAKPMQTNDGVDTTTDSVLTEVDGTEDDDETGTPNKHRREASAPASDAPVT
jgi:hypothetical protein